MALPPTPLTQLLYSAPSPGAMYDALKAAGSLSRRARSKRGEVVAMIAGVIESSRAHYSANAGMVGPSAVDQVARALVSSSYLSARGKALDSAHPETQSRTQKSWWQFWK